MGMLVVFFVSISLVFVSRERVVVESYEVDEFFGTSKAGVVVPAHALMVNLTLILGSSDRKAVCLDGTPPGYYLNAGFGSGANSWLIQLEGGGWCNTVKNCIYRKKTRHGSSNFFEKTLQFIGILGNNSNENPDFYNWNRVKVRYCDGASFAGDSENTTAGLQFRGQRVWRAVMKELMSKGMHNASQALLSGCSAGGLASILHCDNFGSLFPKSTKVKCLSDAGLFMDAADVSGRRTMRKLFIQVVRLHVVKKSVHCPRHRDRASCFFPQNLIANIKTPLFILNAAYDSWQIQQSLVSKTTNANGTWNHCKSNYMKCSERQMVFFYRFRKQMLNATKGFAALSKNGLYINSCFAHGQSEREDTWFSPNSPNITGMRIADAVGAWYKYGMPIKTIEGESCGPTCHNLIFR